MKGSPLDDPKRLAALRRLALLDSPPEEALDHLTQAAAALLHAPVALCSIIAPDRQFFKSSFGLPEPFASKRQTPLGYSFCQHVVLGLKPLIVPDARKDSKFKESPAVTKFQIVAYAGMPLITPEGEAVGSFCVIDTKPREWTAEEMSILRELANMTMREFQLKDMTRQVMREHQARKELTDALVEELAEPLERMSFVLQASGPDGRLAEGAAEEAVEEVQRLKIKLNDIIDVARLETGRIEPEMKPVNLRHLLAICLARVERFAGEKRIVIEAKAPEDLPRVMGDPTLLRRVIENLLMHAIRFTDIGSLVYLEASADDHNVRLSVSDTGMGLTDEVRMGIFEKVLPETPSGESTPFSGLGLTYCRAAIEAHGGSIGVFSQEGVGTTIWFSLPREVC